MQRISDISCGDYRQLVREAPLFVPYFRQATPELELGSLNIGSRPAKRNPKGGRPRADDRLVFEGILWVLKTGARWQDLPEKYLIKGSSN